MLTSNRVGRGTYWRAAGFAEALAQRGYTVTLLAVGEQRTGVRGRQQAGVTLVETPDLHPTSGYDPWDTAQRLAWLRGRHFDLIHAFESRPVVIFPALAAQRQSGAPLVMDWCDWFGRGGSVEERPNPLLRLLLRPTETFFEERFRTRADGTTVINSVLRRKAVALGVPPDSILYLPNGANVDGIRPQPMAAVRARLGLPPDALILGYTGAMFRRDGLLMAEAFERIYQRERRARLLLIGYNNVDVAARLRTAKTAVLRTGRVSYQALADYVAACNVGWLTLYNSGANQGRFPMKAYDFMAAGRPLLVTNVADLGALVREHKIGRVSPDDPVELADRTLALLQDAAAQEAMGARGRRVVETEFATAKIAASLDAFYRRLLHES